MEFDGVTPVPEYRSFSFLPTVFSILFTTLAILPWYTVIVIALAEFPGVHYANVSRFSLFGPPVANLGNPNLQNLQINETIAITDKPHRCCTKSR
jgi:hypothetical protein